MRGLLSRLFLCLVLAGASSGPSAPTVAQGAAIYTKGIGQYPIKARLTASRSAVSATSFPCASCHGEDGSDGREGDIVASDLTIAGAMPRTATIVWLNEALTKGRGRSGQALSAAMPRYALSGSDLEALADYARTLPYPHITGVAADHIAISVDPAGAALTGEDITLLRAVTEARLADINAKGGVFGREIRLVGAQEATFAEMAWAPRSTNHAAARLSVLNANNAGCGSLFPSAAEQKTQLERSGASARLLFPANLDQHMPLAQALVARNASSQKAATTMALLLSGLDMLITNLRTEGRRIQPGRYCDTLTIRAREQQHVTIDRNGEILVRKLIDAESAAQ